MASVVLTASTCIIISGSFLVFAVQTAISVETSNMTNTKVRSAGSHLLVAPPGECYYNTIMFRLVLIIECGITHFLCAMRVFEFRASSSPLGFVPNFVFFTTSIAGLAHGEKLRTQSLAQLI